MKMFWGANIILKGEEMNAFFEGVETKVPTSLTSYTWVNRGVVHM